MINIPNMPDKPKTYPGSSRNKPCPCGSGKKQKNCCEAKLKQEKANIKTAIEEMRKRVYADARFAVDKCKKDGSPANLTENEKAALGIIGGAELIPDHSRIQEGIVTFKLKYPINIVVVDGKIGVQEVRPVPTKEIKS